MSLVDGNFEAKPFKRMVARKDSKVAAFSKE